MIPFDIFDLYKRMGDQNVLLSYKGTLSQETLTGLGLFIKDALFLKSTRDQYIKKVFSIFIELTQNILKYSAERTMTDIGMDVGVGIIVISEKENIYRVTSANYIKKENGDMLTKRCNTINSMDQEELKAHYKTVRKQPADHRLLGPGLGLIDIARKSTGHLDFQIEPISNEESFFVLSVQVKEN